MNAGALSLALFLVSLAGFGGAEARVAESAALILNARINFDRLIQHGLGVSDFMHNETLHVNVEIAVPATGELYTIESLRIALAYRVWYDPSYVVVVGLLNSDKVLFEVIRVSEGPETLSSSKLHEVLYYELGLLSYLDIIADFDGHSDVEAELERVGFEESLLRSRVEFKLRWRFGSENALSLPYRVEGDRATSAPDKIPSESEAFAPANASTTEASGESAYPDSIHAYYSLIYALAIAVAASLVTYLIFKLK